jgi:hypothetical protein
VELVGHTRVATARHVQIENRAPAGGGSNKGRESERTISRPEEGYRESRYGL